MADKLIAHIEGRAKNIGIEPDDYANTLPVLLKAIDIVQGVPAILAVAIKEVVGAADDKDKQFLSDVNDAIMQELYKYNNGEAMQQDNTDNETTQDNVQDNTNNQGGNNSKDALLHSLADAFANPHNTDPNSGAGRALANIMNEVMAAIHLTAKPHDDMEGWYDLLGDGDKLDKGMQDVMASDTPPSHPIEAIKMILAKSKPADSDKAAAREPAAKTKANMPSQDTKRPKPKAVDFSRMTPSEMMAYVAKERK